MKLKLVPEYRIDLNMDALNDIESYRDEKIDESLSLRLAPFFIGPKGDKGADGDTGTGNFLQQVDW